MELNRMVTAVNRVQEALLDIGWEPIPLPQIVLIGEQGCGKSSVLESLIGETIVPCVRTTRRPLIVQLVSCSQEMETGDVWIEFQHRPNKVFMDFEAVMTEIECETQRMAGRNKGICAVPIMMKLYSADVMNATFVDLPGLTRVKVGDQPEDIEKIVKKHIMKYIKYQNSIILAVVSANTDIETSEILQLVKTVDPTGTRTVCVVTKLDIMDAGTNALDILQGKVIDFKLGLVGVVNRSQKEIDEGVTITEALRKEEEFLERRYKSIARKHGAPYLNKKLNKLLMKHLKSKMQDLQEKIQEDIDSYGKSLLPFGKTVVDSQEGLLCFLTKFVGAYSDSVSGTCKNIGTYELEGGARIGYIFQEIFTKALQNMNPLEGYDKSAILTALKNSSGTKPSLFVPQHCFEHLVKRQILHLIEPSVCCVRLVQDELVRMTFNCDKELSQQIERFPRLRCKIFQVVANLAKSRLPETTEMVENVIKMHTAYINTAHPDFLSETYKYRRVFSNVPDMILLKKDVTETYSVHDEEGREEFGVIVNPMVNECILIESMITSYFNIIRKAVADAVPKIIMHFMVNYISDHLLTELVACIYSEGDPTVLLEETPLLAAQRERVTKMVDNLSKAQSIFNDFMKIR